MKCYLVVCSLIAAASAVEPIFRNYHEEVGIPRAEQIRLAEEAGQDNGRIFNGQPANVGQFPHMAGLLISLMSGWLSACGSSLISNTKLVTAAHCWVHFDGVARMFTVVLGSTTLYTGGVRIDTNNVVVHPQYNEINLNNDVAVITIPWTPFNNLIQPINLAGDTSDFSNQWATVAGFGITSSVSGISPVQNFVTLRVISNDECRPVFGPQVIISSTICTDGSTHNVCSSDSGSPLTVGNQLVGIVSFTSALIGCGVGAPSGHARVSSFAPWIRAQM